MDPIAGIAAPTSELKFAADAACEGIAASLLMHICRPDHDYPTGTVSSIYYDTLDLASYREKLNGDFLKSKVRVRWYDTPRPAVTAPVAFLELKLRAGSSRRKVRTPLPVAPGWVSAVPLEDFRIRELPYRHGEALRAMIPAALYPVLTVTYDRRRFVCPLSGARISLDTAIRVTKVNSTVLPAGPGSRDLSIVVIEVKGPQDRHVPWLDYVYRVGFRLRALSKYAAAVTRVTRGDRV